MRNLVAGGNVVKKVVITLANLPIVVGGLGYQRPPLPRLVADLLEPHLANGLWSLDVRSPLRADH